MSDYEKDGLQNDNLTPDSANDVPVEKSSGTSKVARPLTEKPADLSETNAVPEKNEVPKSVSTPDVQSGDTETLDDIIQRYDEHSAREAKEKLNTIVSKRTSSGRSVPMDDFDDLEFVTADSVRDTSKAAAGEPVANDDGPEIRTTRKSVDKKSARKKKMFPVWIILIIVIIVAAIFGWKFYQQKKADKQEAQENAPISAQELEKNDNQAIAELFRNYYAAYAEGDTDTMLKYAYPMSDTEKSYIKMYSEFVDEYDNVTCYIKNGMEDGTYLVTVAFDEKYKDVETACPRTSNFYVRTASDGSVYIDNTYSSFNLIYQENVIDPTIRQYIQTYEDSDDVVALNAGIATSYESALDSDTQLQVKVDEIAAAVAQWQADLEASEAQDTAETTQEVQDEEARQKAAEEAAAAAEAAKQKAEQQAALLEETPAEGYVYTTDGIRIRKSPNETSEVITSVVAGTQLYQLATTAGGWSKVQTGDSVGYCKTEYLSTQAPQTTTVTGQQDQ